MSSITNIISAVFPKIVKWALIREDFHNLYVNTIVELEGVYDLRLEQEEEGHFIGCTLRSRY